MGFSKADFKARRESLGLTQQNMADAAGVNVQTVKRWERPDCQEPPEDVWDFVVECERSQAEAVEAAVSAVISRGRGPVQITYYRSQGQYDEKGRDSGPFGMANANARLVAWRLKSLGVEVDFSYPDDECNMYHNG